MNVNIPTGSVSCYATKAGKITDPYFYVRVPILGLGADNGDAKIEIKAKNACDYRIYHDGDIDAESAEDWWIEEMYASIPPGPIIPSGGHYHKHVGQSNLRKVHYYHLNDVPVNVGDLLFGVFLDGDTRNLLIWHIPHKVPIGGDVVYD